MNEDATMNENACQYAGLTREECRKKLLDDLEEAGLLLRVEEMTHSVGHSERTGVMVEPYLSKQWFVKMGELSANVLKNQKNKDTKVNFVPERFEKILNHWMEISYDWCISRQLWWGHRIPAWYRGDEVYVGVEPPKEDGWIQDEGVLDTWFSSALWPFSTLGWPDKTDDFLRYFPTDCLVTAYDIIFFWVARMVFQSEYINGVRPFKECVIHGLIRDKEGRKMSKSLGNGVDPMDLIAKYGVDSLRFYLTTDVSLGTDLRFDEEKVKSTWNFINKLWNASRFVLMNIETLEKYDFSALNNQDKWILTKYENLLKKVTKQMDKYEFNLVGSEIYSFVWEDFCSNYIEFSKFSNDSLTTKSVLRYVLEGILKLLHPFMPFVTEEIYQMLPFKEHDSIMLSEYPKYNKNNIYKAEAEKIDLLIDFVREFRNVKVENNIAKDYKVKINNNEDYELIKKILKLNEIITNEELNITKFNVSNKLYNVDIYYEKQVTKEDLEQINKQINMLKNNILRRTKLLSNEGYLNKAPKELVQQEKDKLEEEKELLSKLENN